MTGYIAGVNKMTFDEFKEEVKDFIFIASEYMNGWDVLYFDGEDGENEYTAELTVHTPYGDKKRTIPIGIDGCGQVAIMLDGDNDLELNTTGLYVWLWHEAEAELARAI